MRLRQDGRIAEEMRRGASLGRLQAMLTQGVAGEAPMKFKVNFLMYNYREAKIVYDMSEPVEISKNIIPSSASDKLRYHVCSRTREVDFLANSNSWQVTAGCEILKKTIGYMPENIVHAPIGSAIYSDGKTSEMIGALILGEGDNTGLRAVFYLDMSDYSKREID